MKYPKIKTLFRRDPKTHKIIVGDFEAEAFRHIPMWQITEKVHGVNTRVVLYEDGGYAFLDRAGKGKLPALLLDHLCKTFTLDRLGSVLHDKGTPPSVTLFGEGYGPKVQGGGGGYRDDASFRLFDVFVEDPGNPLGGWWLEWADVADISEGLGVKTVPVLGTYNWATATSILRKGYNLDPKPLLSVVAKEEGGDGCYRAEGIVAKPLVNLFTRSGARVVWKLKSKDF